MIPKFLTVWVENNFYCYLVHASGLGGYFFPPSPHFKLHTSKKIPFLSLPIPSSHFPLNGWDSSLRSTSCYHAKQKCSFSPLPSHSSSSLLCFLKFGTRMLITAEQKTAALIITCSKQNAIFPSIM